jgi:hypothetical protein
LQLELELLETKKLLLEANNRYSEDTSELQDKLLQSLRREKVLKSLNEEAYELLILNSIQKI